MNIKGQRQYTLGLTAMVVVTLGMRRHPNTSMLVKSGDNPLAGNLLPNNCQRNCPAKQFFVRISHVPCTHELKRAYDKMGEEIQEPMQKDETHKIATQLHNTYRAIVTHLSLFDDTVTCRYVAHISSTTVLNIRLSVQKET